MSTLTATPATAPSRALHYGLWAAQLVLAAMFAFAGQMKVFSPEVLLAKGAAIDPNLLLFIGVAELAGAAGMVLPTATGIQPRLTALAAVGLFTIMVLATALHASRGEPVLITVALGALAAFVAWGRRNG